jgi:hypothetical protein
VTTRTDAGGRFRVADGEEARLTPGAAAAAEVWSRGFLPLRMRSEGSFRLQAAFPGTAIVLGEDTFEVLSETELPEDGLVVYRMRPWPEGEVVRDRVVYGPAFVRSAEAERERARCRARARRWRFLLYPVVGLLPEETQERVCDRLGLYAVTATLVSGLVESFGVILMAILVARAAETGAAIMMVASLPGLILLVLPGLGRAFGAVFLRETAGSAPVALVFEALRALGALREHRDRSFVPLTRPAFWERLGRPDTVEASPDGTLVFRGLLPHLTWGSRRLSAGRDYWGVVPEPPVLDRGRLVYSYRLLPLGDAPAPDEPPPCAPPGTTYAEEVVQGVRREWDGFNEAFAWLTCMLSSEVQARAFTHRGGPSAVRRATTATAAAGAALGLYLLSCLPGGPAADPLAPFVGALSVALVVDALQRVRAMARGEYAPSLFRFALPSDSLRPERVAYHAHRDAERATLITVDRAG